MLANEFHLLVKDLAATRGPQFFTTLLLGLQQSLQANHMFIAECEAQLSVATTLALVSNNQVRRNCTYSLAGTPCMTVLAGKPISLNGSVAKTFSHCYPLVNNNLNTYIGVPLRDSRNQISGVLVALFHDTLADIERVEAVLLLFAGLANRELECYRNSVPLALSSPATIDRDALTNLPNCQILTSAIEHFCTKATKETEQLALLTISLDNFRYVNQSVGHEIADKLLVACARRIQGIGWTEQLAARIASDEFALLLPLHQYQRIAPVCIALNEEISKPFIIDNHKLKISASIGVAVWPDDAASANELLAKSAQAADYKKSLGKNGFAYFSANLLLHNSHKLYLKQALIHALHNRELEVFYQPIINLQSRTLEKCEALVRWNLEGKQIAPLDFIPIAEEFGLAKQLGDFVWETTCDQLEKFNQNGMEHMKISVNRSMAEFPEDKYCSKEWLDLLKRKNLNHQRISFEITETILAPNNKGFSDYLANLKANGCSISLDDFGTGYSSLSYLRNFPIDYLKIDRSFIHDMEHSEEAVTLVSSIIAMAKSLNIKTIAEGVETKFQLQMLEQLECDFIQGFLFSKPIKSDDFIEYSNSFCYDSTLAEL